jgi:signal transduction histidine kinase
MGTDNVKQLRAQLQELREDYEALKHNFDIMSDGYQESLLLYDKLMETYHELEESNKQLDIARHRAEEASRMKTYFIQQISHEIRTPLNILSGFTQVLTMPDMELDNATKEEVAKGIGDNTERITSLVNKMLELADAKSSDELERNDDVPAVQIAAQAADESRITLASHLTFDIDLAEGADMAMLHTNLHQATRALSLLLDNAMKFTHPAEAAGGAAAVKEKARVMLRLSLTTEQQIAFAVEDTGIGVPPEEAEHIFEEFVQLDDYYDGTGIGLTVARSIARRLGGDIVLDTDYTNGARFVFTLPI